jgi:Tfp pilus assembly protein FimT
MTCWKRTYIVCFLYSVRSVHKVVRIIFCTEHVVYYRNNIVVYRKTVYGRVSVQHTCFTDGYLYSACGVRMFH